MRPIAKSLQEYARGIAGGLLFSLPLLYTMEVWWAGHNAHPWRVFCYVLATFALLLGYNHYAGLRRDASFVEVAIDSVEEMGLGLLVAAVMLWLLGRVTFEMQPQEIVGKIVVEAMTVAIGVSVGTAQLGGDADEGVGDDTQAVENGRQAGGQPKEEVRFGDQLVIAFCGAVLFAANVAPTEEIVMIASGISSWKLLGLAMVSLTLGAVILYYSEFMGARELVPTHGTIGIFFGSIATYAVALVSSAAILWFFGRFDGVALITCIAQTIVLALAATLGASAGRLLLQ